MELVYLLVSEEIEISNIIIYDNLQDAIASSIENPEKRVCIFKKTEDGYKPIYKYYKNGKLYN